MRKSPRPAESFTELSPRTKAILATVRPGRNIIDEKTRRQLDETGAEELKRRADAILSRAPGAALAPIGSRTSFELSGWDREGRLWKDGLIANGRHLGRIYEDGYPSISWLR